MRKLTPYDTGKRAEPKQWEKRHFEDEDDYGKVDFNADDDFTIATLYLERDPDGTYVVRGYTNESLRVEIESNDPTDDEITITMVEKEEDNGNRTAAADPV
jgi:hypothetical protein